MAYVSLFWSLIGTKLGRYAAFGLLGVVLLLSAYIKGRADYKEVCEAKAAAEYRRQVKANELARQMAETVIENLERAAGDLTTKIQEVQDAADKDPTATSCGIGADSVQRIDKIR